MARKATKAVMSRGDEAHDALPKAWCCRGMADSLQSLSRKGQPYPKAMPSPLRAVVFSFLPSSSPPRPRGATFQERPHKVLIVAVDGARASVAATVPTPSWMRSGPTVRFTASARSAAHRGRLGPGPGSAHGRRAVTSRVDDPGRTGSPPPGPGFTGVDDLTPFDGIRWDPRGPTPTPSWKRRFGSGKPTWTWPSSTWAIPAGSQRSSAPRVPSIGPLRGRRRTPRSPSWSRYGRTHGGR